MNGLEYLKTNKPGKRHNDRYDRKDTLQNQLTDQFKNIGQSLNYVIRKEAINYLKIITTYKSSQIAAYADDINIMERTFAAVTEVYVDMEDKA